jgi:hypothetical protein
VVLGFRAKAKGGVPPVGDRSLRFRRGLRQHKPVDNRLRSYAVPGCRASKGAVSIAGILLGGRRFEELLCSATALLFLRLRPGLRLHPLEDAAAAAGQEHSLHQRELAFHGAHDRIELVFLRFLRRNSARLLVVRDG